LGSWRPAWTTSSKRLGSNMCLLKLKEVEAKESCCQSLSNLRESQTC
jgi:hypothetical protein